jgi:hypothetical protein
MTLIRILSVVYLFGAMLYLACGLLDVALGFEKLEIF